jgi:hypothetical protein
MLDCVEPEVDLILGLVPLEHTQPGLPAEGNQRYNLWSSCDGWLLFLVAETAEQSLVWRSTRASDQSTSFLDHARTLRSEIQRYVATPTSRAHRARAVYL